ncbi:serine hydrolase [Haliea sp. E1-2-M8]|uniref:serine hydrolase domain-containing protein n=1 Tax=Haliea sp. E1-2-M8 TaxID=3064706 RepID=UPI0027179697|nr:serine hydrolase [Haliea sp. E1-2-M8]MDO8863330.1 serine hydrolase [Haliea sp. E1-2-M8]
MKKLLVLMVLVLTVAVLAAPSLLGFSLWRLGDALAVATGMGAKLGCSGYFVSGQEHGQIIDDLASYTPINRRLTLEFGDNRAEASLFGLAATSATWRPGLGCSLDIGDTAPLDTLVANDDWAGAAPVLAPARLQDTALQAAVTGLLAADQAAGLQTRALLVLQDGKLVAESYAEGYGPDTPLLGWSMGKSVVAILLGRMEALGRLPVDPPLPLFAAWAGDERREVTLQQMLQMTSGLDWDETYAPGSDSTRMLFQAHSAAAVAMVSPLAHEPGTTFSYSSGTTNLLAKYLHDRLGGPQAQLDFLHRELLQPLGLRQTLLEIDPSGVLVGSSYIYSSARDWARLGQLLLGRGRVNGEQLLSADWVARAIRPNPSVNDPRYGYQLWLNAGGDSLRWPDLPADAYAMQGNRGQVVMIVPSRGAVLVRLGWTEGEYPVSAGLGQLLVALPADR